VALRLPFPSSRPDVRLRHVDKFHKYFAAFPRAEDTGERNTLVYADEWRCASPLRPPRRAALSDFFSVSQAVLRFGAEGLVSSGISGVPGQSHSRCVMTPLVRSENYPASSS
jgi:hypothetical protein